VHGQGVLVFEYSGDSYTLTFFNMAKSNRLTVAFTRTVVQVTRFRSQESQQSLLDNNNSKGLCEVDQAYY
jgi:hypothetical protein